MEFKMCTYICFLIRMKKINYFLIKVARFIFSMIPFSLLYPLSDFVAWILRVVVRYRVDVAKKNLKRAFPRASEQDLKTFLVQSYKNLSDITLETMKGYTLSANEVKKRYHFRNPEHLTQYFAKGQSVVLTLAHVCNWEWAGLALGLLAPKQILCIYHPIKNKDIDQLVCRERSRFGMVMFRPENTRTLIKQLNESPGAMVLVADQSPPKAASALWVEFFGTETGFVPGPEFVAKRNRFPVVNMHINRVQRGYYEIEFVTITDHPEREDKKSITRAYAKQLEHQINQAPSAWLWTHKRWKKVKPEGLKKWR